MFRPQTTDSTVDRDAEWRDAALLDRAEKAEAEAATLRAKLERLETELLVARLWCKELALWLDEALERTGGTALPSGRS